MPETWNSTISVVSYKSRIRATVSSNLSSSSSNLMLLGTAVRFVEANETFAIVSNSRRGKRALKKKKKEKRAEAKEAGFFVDSFTWTEERDGGRPREG